MKLLQQWSSHHPLPHKALTWGVFDGMHAGHHFLLQKLIQSARASNISSVLIMIEPNPKKVLQDDQIREVMPLSRRIHYAKEWGIDEVYELTFDDQLRLMSAEAFLVHLTQIFDVRFILAGYDLRFGFRQQGDWDFLRRFAEQKGIQAVHADALTLENGVTISSRWIRQKIAEGDLMLVKQALGRAFELSGSWISTRGVEDRGLYHYRFEVDQKQCRLSNGLYQAVGGEGENCLVYVSPQSPIFDIWTASLLHLDRYPLLAVHQRLEHADRLPDHRFLKSYFSL